MLGIGERRVEDGHREDGSAPRIRREMWPRQAGRPSLKKVQRAIQMLTKCRYITTPKHYMHDQNYPISACGYVVRCDEGNISLRPCDIISYREVLKDSDAPFDEQDDAPLSQQCRSSVGPLSQLCRSSVASPLSNQVIRESGQQGQPENKPITIGAGGRGDEDEEGAMPSSTAGTRPWEGDWASAPRGCSPTAVAWLLAEGKAVPEEAPADAAAAGRALFDAAYSLGRNAPSPKPRRPVLWETWDRDIADDQGTIEAARLRRGIHYSFHPDPEVQPYRYFAAHGLSVGIVERLARKIVEDVPQDYNPVDHPWWPDPSLRDGMRGCPMCNGNGSRTEQLPRWREVDCPCKRARLDRAVEGLPMPGPAPRDAGPVPDPPARPVQPPARWSDFRPSKRPLGGFDILGPNTRRK